MADAQPVDDDAWLDLVLDRHLAARLDGGTLDTTRWLAERPHLRDSIREVLACAEPWCPTPPVPRRLGPYEILDEVGRGAMGVVYRALQPSLGRIVAIKVHDGDPRSSHGRTRFRNEARSLARIRHPCVVAIHDVVEDGDVLAYAMEWIDGGTLADRLRRAALEPEDVGRIGASLARALAAVHSAGLLHRDVKPSNVLLRPDGSALLSDFGLAGEPDVHEATRSGEFLGTTAYSPPEQLRGDWDAVDARSDVYALGSTLYHALAGRLPHEASTIAKRLRLAERGCAPVMRVTGRHRDLGTILGRCLEPDPARRYPSAQDLADDLDRLLTNQPIRARPPSIALRTLRLARRHRVAALVTAVLVLTVALGVIAASARGAHEIVRVARAVAALESARTALLDLPFGDRTALALRDRPLGPVPALRNVLDAALGDYTTALDLDPSDLAVATEAAVLRVAKAGLAGENVHDLAEALPQSLPLTRELASLVLDGDSSQRPGRELTARVRAASPEDRRGLGLLAYAAGGSLLCLAAWQGLELSGDPLVDAALGQTLVAADRHDEAAVCLQSAHVAFPHSASLRYAWAECLAATGRVDQAEAALGAGRDQPANDSRARNRAAAAIAVARSDTGAAIALLQANVALDGTDVDHRRLASLLEQCGRLRESVAIRLEQARFGFEDDRRELRATAEAWWESLGSWQRIVAIAEALRSTGSDAGILSRLVPFFAGPLAIGFERESPTLGGPLSASRRQTRLMDQALLWEMLRMDTAYYRRSSSTVAFVAGSIAAAANAVPHSAAPIDAARGFTRSILIGIALLFTTAEAPSQVTWRARSSSVSPSDRFDTALCFDPIRGVTVMFGGCTQWGVGYGRSDTWEWDGIEWRLRSTNGPEARWGHVLVWSPVHGAALLFGGSSSASGGSGGYLNDTWIWDGSTWSQLSPATSPTGVSHASLVWDSSRNRAVLFGGDRFGASNEVWEWNGTTWASISVTGAAPVARHSHAASFDSHRNRMVIHGGFRGPGGLSDTWEYDGSTSTWSQRASGTPSIRWKHAMTFDPTRGVTVLFDGWVNGGSATETWEWDGVAWQRRVPVGTPAVGNHIALSFDVARRVVVKAGRGGGAVQPFDVWEYAPTSPASVTPFGIGSPRTGGAATLGIARQSALPYLGMTPVVRAANVNSGQPVWLVAGSSRTAWNGSALPMDLAAVGITGGHLYVGFDFVAAVGIGSTSGHADLPIAIPVDTSLVTGSAILHLQGLFPDPGANPAAVSTTNALSLIVGSR